MGNTANPILTNVGHTGKTDMTYKQGAITACEVCYDGKGERTGEVQGDPLAESPEEEGHVLLSCELSSKAL